MSNQPLPLSPAMPDFTPAQVLVLIPPFTGCFNNAEAEQAAGLMVLVCAERGAWGDVEAPAVGALIERALEEEESLPRERRSDASQFVLGLGPFFRPDAWRLVRDGFAEWVGDAPGHALRFTDKGYAGMARYVRPFGGAP